MSNCVALAACQFRSKSRNNISRSKFHVSTLARTDWPHVGCVRCRQQHTRARSSGTRQAKQSARPTQSYSQMGPAICSACCRRLSCRCAAVDGSATPCDMSNSSSASDQLAKLPLLRVSWVSWVIGSQYDSLGSTGISANMRSTRVCARSAAWSMRFGGAGGARDAIQRAWCIYVRVHVENARMYVCVYVCTYVRMHAFVCVGIRYALFSKLGWGSGRPSSRSSEFASREVYASP